MTADELARILDELGERLGPTGEYVFGLAVRQVYIDAITSLVVLGVASAILVGLIRPVYRWVQDGSDDRGFVAVIGLGAYAFVVAILFFFAVALVPKMFNPEYAALRDILGAIGR